MPSFLKQLKELGFAGVQNFPTVSSFATISHCIWDKGAPDTIGENSSPCLLQVGLIDGQFRQNLEETGMGFDAEVEMVRTARAMDLLTTPYAFSVNEADQMARAGADLLVAHMGLTTAGSIGAQSGKTLDDCVKLIQEMRDVAVSVNPDVLVLCHGGPIARPKDAEYVLSRTTGVHGFYGASSMERLPVEEAITNITKEFKHIRVQ